MSSTIVALYNHYRGSSIDTNQWVNTDLQLVPKPGYLHRVFGDTSSTKIFKVTEKLSEITCPKALFVKKVLEIAAARGDRGFRTLQKLNHCRELIQWIDPELGLEEKLDKQEEAYFAGQVDYLGLGALHRKLQILPHNTWSQLTSDLLMPIFARLPFKDLAAATRVCKEWAAAGKSQWQRQKTLKVNIPYLSSFHSATLAHVSKNRAWMAGLVGRRLNNRCIGTFSTPVTYATSSEACVLQTERGHVIVYPDGRYKTLCLGNVGHPFIDDHNIYVIDCENFATRIRKVENGFWRQEIKIPNRLAKSQSCFKGTAYLLSYRTIVAVDLKTGKATDLLNVDWCLWAECMYDRYISRRKKNELHIQNLSDVTKPEVCLKGSGRHIFLGAMPNMLFVQNRENNNVQAHCMDTGDIIGVYELGERAQPDSASVSDGILYIKVHEQKLVYFDLLTCTKLSSLFFPTLTKVIPFAQSILYTDRNELRMLK